MADSTSIIIFPPNTGDASVSKSRRFALFSIVKNHFRQKRIRNNLYCKAFLRISTYRYFVHLIHRIYNKKIVDFSFVSYFELPLPKGSLDLLRPQIVLHRQSPKTSVFGLTSSPRASHPVVPTVGRCLVLAPTRALDIILNKMSKFFYSRRRAWRHILSLKEEVLRPHLINQSKSSKNGFIRKFERKIYEKFTNYYISNLNRHLDVNNGIRQRRDRFHYRSFG